MDWGLALAWLEAVAFVQTRPHGKLNICNFENLIGIFEPYTQM
jgi:hypothetical protein